MNILDVSPFSFLFLLQFHVFFVQFTAQSVEDLVRHALRALRDTLANDQELSSKLVSVAVVGKDHPFQVYDDELVQDFVCFSPFPREVRRWGDSIFSFRFQLW
jgi:hypothetical protein